MVQNPNPKPGGGDPGRPNPGHEQSPGGGKPDQQPGQGRPGQGQPDRQPGQGGRDDPGRDD